MKTIYRFLFLRWRTNTICMATRHMVPRGQAILGACLSPHARRCCLGEHTGSSAGRLCAARQGKLYRRCACHFHFLFLLIIPEPREQEGWFDHHIYARGQSEGRSTTSGLKWGLSVRSSRRKRETWLLARFHSITTKRYVIIWQIFSTTYRIPGQKRYRLPHV